MQLLENKLTELNEYRNNIHNIIESRYEQKLMIEYIDYVNAVAKSETTEEELQTLIDKWYSGNMKAKEKLLEISQPYIVMTIIKNFSDINVPIYELIHAANKSINNMKSKNINANNYYYYIRAVIHSRCKWIQKKVKLDKSNKNINQNENINTYTIEDEIINYMNYEEILGKLSNKSRTIINLRYEDEFSMQKIADLENCKKQNIEQYLQRSHENLKKIYIKNSIKNDIDMYFDNLTEEEKRIVYMILSDYSLNKISKCLNLNKKNNYIKNIVLIIYNKLKSKTIDNNNFSLLLDKCKTLTK